MLDGSAKVDLEPSEIRETLEQMGHMGECGEVPYGMTNVLALPDTFQHHE
ncbi:hypothetical protein [Novosphingobium panipatense]|nr:hypothetical protein [Novosphingobium panipatense]